MAEESGLATMDLDESGDDNIVVTLGPVIQPTFVRENIPIGDYDKLISLGFDERVATKLDEIFKTGMRVTAYNVLCGKFQLIIVVESFLGIADRIGMKKWCNQGFEEEDEAQNMLITSIGKLTHSDLDGRALDALKEFPVDGALCVLMQFVESNLEHVSNKSAYLCGIMKTSRQKNRAGQKSQMNNLAKGPNDEKIKTILERTGYPLDVTTGQRKYGGPPPDWIGPTPGNGCEVFCGKIPRDVYEDELIPLFENCGKIWDLRLMMDPMTGLNRGFAFITYVTKEAANKAVQELNDYMIKPGKPLKVNISVPNLRLFVGNIPKSKGQEEILEEFSKITVGLAKVIIYSSPDDEKKNRGFCFLEYESHKAASLAKRRLSTLRTRIWGLDIFVDWADPQEEPDEETMSKVKVLYVRNLTIHCTEQNLKNAFEIYGHVERVKKIKDYAFVHFEERDSALKAMGELNGLELCGSCIEVSLAKPPFDKKKKEVMLRAREKRTMMMLVQRECSDMTPQDVYLIRHINPRASISGGHFIGGGHPRSENYLDFDNFMYGDYRGGYNDPLYDDVHGYEDFYYDNLRPSQNPAIRQPIRMKPSGDYSRSRMAW